LFTFYNTPAFNTYDELDFLDSSWGLCARELYDLGIEIKQVDKYRVRLSRGHVPGKLSWAEKFQADLEE